MKLKELLIGFVTYFSLTLVASIIVSFLYSLIIHKAGVVDWEASFRLAVIFGIIFPFTNILGSGKKEK